MRWRRRGLFLHRDFLALWTGESISAVGSQITQLALPLTAILVLGASEEQMGLFRAVGTLPFLFIGLLAGVWVDRMHRRPLLIGVNVANALLVASVPLGVALGWLSMAQLYAVSFCVGITEVLGVAGYQAYITTLVGRRRLVDANAKLEVSSSIATMVGPSLAGVLVQLLTAPIAMALDAISFVAAVVGLAVIRKPEPLPRAAHERGSLITEIREGLGSILHDPRLRLITACGATHNFFANGMISAILVLFAVRQVGLSPAELGFVFAATGPGVLLGALLAGPLPRRIGVGPTIAHMQTLTGASMLLLASASVLGHVGGFLALALGQFVWGVARVAFNVTQVSLRQSVTPDHLLGRMNASIRFLMWCVAPVGAITGGVVAGVYGLPVAMLIGGLGTVAAAFWVYRPAVWRITQLTRSELRG